MQMYFRIWKLVTGHLSRVVSFFERRNPEALLELEQEKFRALVGQFNNGLVAHATLIERLKSGVASNAAKALQISTKMQALIRAGDRKAASRYALELQKLESVLASDRQKLNESEAKYHYLAQARDTAVTETRDKIEQLRWQIGDLKVNRAMANLENMAATMVGGIADPGDGLNRLQDLVTDENHKAKGRSRVANANFTATDYAAREREQEALGEQALEDILARNLPIAPLALPDFSEDPIPVSIKNNE